MYESSVLLFGTYALLSYGCVSNGRHRKSSSQNYLVPGREMNFIDPVKRVPLLCSIAMANERFKREINRCMIQEANQDDRSA